ncbi:hypothetical protein BXZ70DRAFT_1004236 [Cristinia sonorae]|uniref:Uncharacterized protein n=1 Tax=Cristinia sonorae TaxID=1940300 RepID=A0A8K0XU81_9AGAR|nr:hypothetical protein BXZ70DRAFT_1004236 [Cristinia sonorae]
MTSHVYEVALFGEFFSKDLSGRTHLLSMFIRHKLMHNVALTLAAILNRITLHSESAHQMHSREIVFEPFDAHYARERDPTNEPVLLRARKELLEPKAKWILYSYLKPESVRVHPEATVRPWATCQVVGDALSFASALGYV